MVDGVVAICTHGSGATTCGCRYQPQRSPHPGEPVLLWPAVKAVPPQVVGILTVRMPP